MPSTAPSAPAGRRPVSAVVADGYGESRALLVASLSSEGVSVLESVDSADAAYESITRTRPDVAVLDSLLPGGPILELCQRLRLEQPGVAVILHAGIVTVQFLRAAERAGAALVVPKSIVDGQLARSVLALGRGTSLAP